MKSLMASTFGALVVMIIVAGLQGCGTFSRKPSYLEIKSDRPNTFHLVAPRSLTPLGEKDYVSSISVFQLVAAEPEGTRVYWRLNAPQPVPAKGFQVVIGEVPDGFEQLIPAQGQGFIPVPGQEYYIAVAVKRGAQTKWETIKWVAEKPFF